MNPKHVIKQSDLSLREHRQIYYLDNPFELDLEMNVIKVDRADTIQITLCGVDGHKLKNLLSSVGRATMASVRLRTPITWPTEATYGNGNGRLAWMLPCSWVDSFTGRPLKPHNGVVHAIVSYCHWWKAEIRGHDPNRALINHFARGLDHRGIVLPNAFYQDLFTLISCSILR